VFGGTILIVFIAHTHTHTNKGMATLKRKVELKIVLRLTSRGSYAYSSRYEDLLAVNFKVFAFWLVTSCSLLDGHVSFASVCGINNGFSASKKNVSLSSEHVT
jgi:hypothetical protein